MKIIEQKDNQIKFTAQIEESLANTIRRYLNQIPVLAIDEIEITQNDSALYDETVAHRMGLIPLKIEKVINDKTELKLKIDVKKEGPVYSGELKGAATVVYEKIPITTLKKGQEFIIEALAKVGKGKDHSKFSPGMIFYRNIGEINLGKECPPEITEICPQRILKLNNGKVGVEDNLKCDMCEACVEFCKKNNKPNAINLKPSKELMITIESFGQYEVKDLFKKSIEILKKDLAEFSKKLSKE